MDDPLRNDGEWIWIIDMDLGYGSWIWIWDMGYGYGIWIWIWNMDRDGILRMDMDGILRMDESLGRWGCGDRILWVPRNLRQLHQKPAKVQLFFAENRRNEEKTAKVQFFLCKEAIGGGLVEKRCIFAGIVHFRNK